MDTMRDFVPFRKYMDKLCAAYDRPTPAKDELVDTFWHLLHEIPFEEFQRNADRLMREARKDSRFPRPGDLRDLATEPTFQRTVSMENNVRHAEQRAFRNLEQMRISDPELWELEVRIARCGRILAAEPPESPQFCEAVEFDRLYRDRRYQLLRRRAEARDVSP